MDSFITDALPNEDAVWVCPVDGCEWAAYGESLEDCRAPINDHLSDHGMSLQE